MSLVYLGLQYPHCKHLLSHLVQDGSNTVVDSNRVAAYSMLRTFTYDRARVVGFGLQESFLIPRSFLNSHYSGTFAGNCIEDPNNVATMYNGYCLLHIYSVEEELHEGL